MTGFEEKDGQVVTNVDVGPAIAAEMVILAIGVSPDSGLAKAAGLEVGVRGSILVDRHMRTSDADIYAVGDAVQVENGVTHQAALIALAGASQQAGPRGGGQHRRSGQRLPRLLGQQRGQAL